MKRVLLLSCLIVPLAACGGLVSRAVTPEPEVAIGSGYRASEDPCRRVGATSLTEPFITSTDDLVGCPIDFEGRPEFQTKTGGREVTRTEDWVIYRVPLVGEGPPPSG
ncbi:MAG: hypothetical protein AAF748_11960 [Pseudomonadota bacterium]